MKHQPIWYLERYLYVWSTFATGLIGVVTFGVFTPNWELKIALWWATRQGRRHKEGKRV